LIYAAGSVTQPNRLGIVFDGRSPDGIAAGARSFTNLVYTDSTGSLGIRYTGGTLAQRRQLARTWAVTVSAR
jgi:hypothetical protein